MVGMMLHQDGSRHQWVPPSWWDLIVTMDDADSTIYSAFFVEEEGTMSSFRGFREVIEQHGLFSYHYLSRNLAVAFTLLPELIDLVWNRKINPGKVFDLTLPLDQVAEGYRAMYERRAVKTLLQP